MVSGNQRRDFNIVHWGEEEDEDEDEKRFLFDIVLIHKKWFLSRLFAEIDSQIWFPQKEGIDLNFLCRMLLSHPHLKVIRRADDSQKLI